MFPFTRACPRQQHLILKTVADVVALFTLCLFGQSGCVAEPQQAVPQTTTMSTQTKPQRLLMAHYMPWYGSKEVSGGWGWHWTMNHFHPDQFVSTPVAGEMGRREGASRYYPLIGLYDSGDPDALQCQVMLMKLAGIDGVIVDWYGNEEFNDYAIVNRNTQRLIPLLQQAGLRFAICYEDQSLAQEVAGGKLSTAEVVPRGQRLMEWMNQNFFASPSYLRFDGRPVLLSFGEPYYKDAQWNELFSVLPTKPLYLTENLVRAQTAATSGFDWPAPKGGAEGASQEQNDFYERAKGWPYFIAAAYPRFQDIYAQAGVQPSWGAIPDDDGRTYTQTLTRALKSDASVVQLVTWNDWGEGTQIEPSVEFGYRDLEVTQRLRRQYLDPQFSHNSTELRLPVEWYRLKKKFAANPKISDELTPFFSLVISGHMNEARSLLLKVKN